MDPRSQLLDIDKKIADLEKKEHQLERRRHDVLQQLMNLSTEYEKDVVNIYSAVTKEFKLKDDWLKEFIDIEQFKKNYIKLGPGSYSLTDKMVYFLWENNDDFKQAIQSFVNKMSNSDDASLLKKCEDLLEKIYDSDVRFNEIKQSIESIHKTSVINNEKFEHLERKREIMLAKIEKFEKSQELEKEKLEKEREKQKLHIENLKLIINDKLFWKDKGVGINESQRKEPKSIGRYRKYLNDEKLSDDEKDAELQRIATEKMKEFGDKKMEKGGTFFKGNTGKMVEKKVHPLLVKLHEFILERNDRLLKEILAEMRESRPIENKSPKLQGRYSDDDL